MRVILIGTVLAGVAIGLFAPIPFLSIIPLQPDAELPTFAETREDLEDPNREAAPPSHGENPERRKLRKAVLHAASQLEFNPCSKDLRKKLVAAIRPFLESIENGPPETAMVNGKEKNVSKRYDKPATDAIFNALMRGHIDPANLAGRWARPFVKAKSMNFPAERMSCDG